MSRYMASKNDKYMAIRYKVDGCNTGNDVPCAIASIRIRGPIARSMMRSLNQQAIKSQSSLTPIFGSMPPKIYSSTLGFKYDSTSIKMTLEILKVDSNVKTLKHDSGLEFFHKTL